MVEGFKAQALGVHKDLKPGLNEHRVLSVGVVLGVPQPSQVQRFLYVMYLPCDPFLVGLCR